MLNLVKINYVVIFAFNRRSVIYLYNPRLLKLTCSMDVCVCVFVCVRVYVHVMMNIWCRESRYILLSDHDIMLAPGIISALYMRSIALQIKYHWFSPLCILVLILPPDFSPLHFLSWGHIVSNIEWFEYVGSLWAIDKEKPI